MRVLVTRPLDDARQTASLLEAAGHQPLLAPFMTVNFLDAALPENVQGLVATSANGVRGFCRLDARRGMPLFAVGSHTADVAREAGFNDVRATDGDAAALTKAITDCAIAGTLLHLAGKDRGDVLAQNLPGLVSVTLYEAVAAAHFPADARSALTDNKIDAALFFSPRSARIFGGCAAADGLSMGGVIAACLSPAVADGLAGLSFREVRIAAQPSQKALIGLL